MHLFIGNMFTGSWWYTAKDGRLTALTPQQVADSKEVVWRPAPDSGDFLWPHLETRPGQLEELRYEDE